MTCLVCKKSFPYHDNIECFSLMLDNLKLHYKHMNDILKQKNCEIQRLQQNNKKLDQIVRFCQQDKWERKLVMTEQGNLEQIRSKINLSADDSDVTYDLNLNIALNSEQLFDTSDLSTLTTDLHRSSALIMCPCVQTTPRSNKQHDILCPLNDKNVQAPNHCSLLGQGKEQAKLKSWATSFIHSNASSIKNDETTRRPEKKLCLSLKGQKNKKTKQTMENYTRKKLNSTFCEETIEVSPVMGKTTIRPSKSWLLRRSDANNGISESDDYDSNAIKKTKCDETIVSIDQIVFDFSPTKKGDMTLADENMSIKINSIPTHSTKTYTEVLERRKALINSPNSLSLNNSSVVVLTPTSQDTIFISDVNDGNSININTMDLVRELKQSGSSTLKNFYKYESKCILKYPSQSIAENQVTNKRQFEVPKPGGFIKVEKITQNNSTNNDIEKQYLNDGETIVMKRNNCAESTQSKKEEDENDDADPMPRPLQIKEGAEEGLKVINIKEKYDIDCQKCEQYIQFFASYLTIREIEDHLDRCPLHNRQRLNTTPEGFWNPHILSFPADDMRNKVLVDSRLRDKKATL